MKLFVAVTDNEWFRFLRTLRPDEVNFWQPSGSSHFRGLSPGEPFLFKLHSPENYIVGGGFYAHFSLLPCSLAWEAFAEKNGADSIVEMRRRIEKYRRIPPQPHDDYQVGCIILTAPFFFDEIDWISVPGDFAPNIVRGRGYDLAGESGAALWETVHKRLAALAPPMVSERADTPMWSEGLMGKRRLGQGAFRILVTDTYERRCAVTKERVLPVLEAAHIRPVKEGGRHEIANGMLLRSDIHRLFDTGYVTVTPQNRFLVSRKIKEDFDNGEKYYQLQGSELWLPTRPDDRPRQEFLEWHNDTIFVG